VNVRVRLFAVARQLAGRESIDLELPHGATVAQLRAALGTHIPQMSGSLSNMLFAIDRRFADDTGEIPENADVACIPPVSGG
jgi:molybdopterin synthase catalytic subunit/molybdopterin synthase sulfur carrier subunit